MATTGAGYRTVIDVLLEMSLRLAQPIVMQSIVSIQVVSATGYGDGGYGDGGYGDSGGGSPTAVIEIASVKFVYVGAQLVLGRGTQNQEVVLVTAVTPIDNTFEAAIVNQHAVGDTVMGATFPAQETTDPIFLQSEMLEYLARAQNEFLSQVPAIYQLVQQQLTQGSVIQILPPATVELDRVAVSTYTAAIRTITRTGQILTVETVDQHGLGKGSSMTITNSADPTLNGVVSADTIVSPTKFSTIMEGGDSQDSSGTAQINSWTRMYEVTQTELTMQGRNWRASYTGTPTAFFEDRSGNMRWGVNTLLQANFPAELLVAVRDADVLGWLDGFLVPDVFLHYVSYKAFEYIFQKDGVRQNPSMAAYCKKRFDRGVQTANRYVDGLQLNLENA